MANKRESELRRNGYSFNGVYSEKKEVALAKAKEYRDDGHFACVLTKIYKGRIYNTEGYTVYIKKKIPLQ